MMAPTSPASKLNSGISGWPDIMPSPSASSKELDRITLAEGAERRRKLIRTLAIPSDRMAGRAVSVQQFLAVLEILRDCRLLCDHGCKQN